LPLEFNLPLLGATLSAPHPIFRIDLPLYKGVTILYGKNGAGKTKILEGLGHALNGEYLDPGCWLHLRVSAEDLNYKPPEDAEHLLTVLLYRALDIEVRQLPLVAAFHDPAEMPLGRLAELLLMEEWQNQGGLFPTKPERLAKEVVAQGRFSLRPSGNGSPAWDISISGSPSEDTPILRWAIERARRWKRTMTGLHERASRGELGPDEAMHLIDQASEELRLYEEDHDVAVGVDLSGAFDAFQVGLGAPWASIPLCVVGSLRLPAGFAMWLGEEDGDRLANASFALAKVCVPLMDLATENEVVPSREAATLLLRISRDASARLREVLGHDGPELRCRLQPWGLSPPVLWEALDPLASSWIPIGDLGAGRSRWAIIAASLAVATASLDMDVDGFSSDVVPDWNDSVILLDEPEIGLHSTAQQAMFDGLKRWGAHRSLVAASHSPAAFRDPAVHLLHVDRDHERSVTCFEMTDDLHDLLYGSGAARMGVDPADILQAIRLFLIVEGEHDVAVIETLLGADDLARARVKVLPMRGTGNLRSVLDARLLFDFTTADILVVLDRTDGPRVETAWQSAKELYLSGNPQAAHAALGDLDRGTPEETKLGEFCHAALRSGALKRVQVYGLKRPDIIEYLPVQEFLPNADSWASVVSSWSHQGFFKHYLRQEGANISTNRIREVAKNLDYLDDEFVGLRRLCFGSAAD